MREMSQLLNNIYQNFPLDQKLLKKKVIYCSVFTKLGSFFLL